MGNSNKIEKMIVLEKLKNINSDLTDLIDYSRNDKDFILISEFIYKGYECAFFKDNSRFTLMYEKNNSVEVLVFNSFEEFLCRFIKLNIKNNHLKQN